MPVTRRKVRVCICPKCGGRHRKSFPGRGLTGRGTPRKYCDKCQIEVGSYDCVYHRICSEQESD